MVLIGLVLQECASGARSLLREAGGLDLGIGSAMVGQQSEQLRGPKMWESGTQQWVLHLPLTCTV